MLKRLFRFRASSWRSQGRYIIPTLALLVACVCHGQTYTNILGVDTTLRRVQTFRSAIIDYYAKYGAVPPVTTNLEPALIEEGFLQKPLSSNMWIRVLPAPPPSTPITGTNQAYSLDGNLTNSVIGSFVLEVVLANVTAAAAREMSLRTDREAMSSPIGEPDLKGRVKYDAIPTGGAGTVYFYLAYR